jgi:hypothetical protein
MKKTIFPFLVFIVFNTVIGMSQEVTISKEIILRSEYYYHLFGYIDERIFLYREKPYSYHIDIFNHKLDLLRTVDLEFTEGNVKIEGISDRDSFFTIFYSYKTKELNTLALKKFNSSVAVIDTLTIAGLSRESYAGNFSYKSSEDGKKSLFYSIFRNKMVLIVIDNDNYIIERFSEHIMDFYNVREELRDAIISNDSQVFLLFEKDHRKSNRRSTNFHILRSINEVDLKIYQLNGKRMFHSGIVFSFDNENKRLVLTGMAGESNEFNMDGYFLFNKHIDSMEFEMELSLEPFDSKLLTEVYGKRNRKQNTLSNYSINDLLHRNDGGVVIFAERKRSITRAGGGMAMAPMVYDNRFGMRNFVDYYNEDLLIMAFHPDGEDHWRKLLYKRQFSQDDEGIFSSYYVFKTPSRMRVVFNDEIKNNNTVGEYFMDPIGNYDRRTVMNTDYLKLKLRFTGAIQTSNKEMIVPSEKNNRLNLVKIKF